MHEDIVAAHLVYRPPAYYERKRIEAMHYSVDHRFTYHPPTPDQIPKFEAVRSKAKDLAHALVDLCPNNNEFHDALKKLDEAVMWANASIARERKSGVHPDVDFTLT